jgi:ectoine hydroxylase-related dioxygenase (phytanoyl-CoA dioxygenase family)
MTAPAARPMNRPTDLDAPYTLTPEQIAAFRRDGFIKLKQVLSPETLAQFGAVITAEVLERSKHYEPLAERSTYGKAFLQIMNLWTVNEVVKTFVLGQRLGRLAAELMGTRGVRIYHDQALYKEAGGGFTPWHADQHYWPIEGDHTVTAWIPLQAVPQDMGPLAFAAGSHRLLDKRHDMDMEISDASEQVIGRTLRDCPIVDAPFDLGEVSFHYGWTFHRAGPNTKDTPRAVMTIIYHDVDARIAQEPLNKAQHSDLAGWLPGLKPGDPAASPLNPVVWQR